MLLQANQAIDNSNDEKGVHLHFSPRRCSQQDVLELKGQLTRTIPEKVIVFSQFLEHIHVIEQQVVLNPLQNWLLLL